MARKIEVAIVGDSRKLERSFARASKAGQKWSVGLGTIAEGALVFAAVERGIDAAADAVRAGAGEWAEQAKVTAQTNAVLKSTGGIANVTRHQVDRLARSVAGFSGIDDEAIQSSENLLLTFKNVRNELGKGNRVFDRATKAAADLSVAGFGSLDSTAKQLGKALNDPVRGMTALGRAGVTFTKGQRDTIKALVESGRLLEAQKLILREVESQVGGSARAFGQTLPGQLSRLREALKNTLGDLVGRVAPVFADLLGRFNDFVAKLSAARTVRAKLDVVWEGVKTATAGATSALGAAVAGIDWGAVWAKARGIADGLQARLEEIDWGTVGKQVGDGFSDAVELAVPAVKDLAKRINDAVLSIDFEKLGAKAGPGLVTGMISAITAFFDIDFWLRNWRLVLAAAIVAFKDAVKLFFPEARVASILLKPFARLGGTLVLRIAAQIERFAPRLALALLTPLRALGRLAGDALVGVLAQIERLAPRLADALLTALVRLPKIAAKELKPLTDVVSRVFAKLGRIGRFVVEVLGLTVAINAVVGFGKKVGQVFAGIATAIKDAFIDAFNFLKRQALRAALAIIEPFSHIPTRAFNWARDLKEKWQSQMSGAQKDAERHTAGIQKAIDGVRGKTATVTVKTRIVDESDRKLPGRGAAGVIDEDVTAKAKRSVAVRAAAVEAAAKKASARETTAANAAANARERSAAAAKAAADRAKAAAAKARKAFEGIIASLGLDLDKAAATRRLSDDLRVLAREEAAVRKEISVEGRTLELERKLFEIRQQRADLRRQQAERAAERRQARQFRLLGLGPTGEEPIPGVKKLRAQLAKVGDAIKGTFLDTGKTRSLLQNIRKLLSGQLGKLSDEVRAKVAQLLADLNQQLRDGGRAGPQTKFRKANVDALLAGLGLDPDQIRGLRARLSQLGAGGTVHGTGSGAFGFAVPNASAPPRAGGDIVVRHTTVLDGRVVERSVTRHQQKRKRSNPVQKRGAHADE